MLAIEERVKIIDARLLERVTACLIVWQTCRGVCCCRSMKAPCRSYLPIMGSGILGTCSLASKCFHSVHVSLTSRLGSPQLRDCLFSPTTFPSQRSPSPSSTCHQHHRLNPHNPSGGVSPCYLDLLISPPDLAVGLWSPTAEATTGVERPVVATRAIEVHTSCPRS